MKLNNSIIKIDCDFLDEFYTSETIYDLPKEWLSEDIFTAWINHKYIVYVSWYPVYNKQCGQFLLHLGHYDSYYGGKYSNLTFFYKRTRSLNYLVELINQASIKSLILIEKENNGITNLKKLSLRKRKIKKNDKLFMRGIRKYI